MNRCSAGECIEATVPNKPQPHFEGPFGSVDLLYQENVFTLLLKPLPESTTDRPSSLVGQGKGVSWESAHVGRLGFTLDLSSIRSRRLPSWGGVRRLMQ